MGSLIIKEKKIENVELGESGFRDCFCIQKQPF
jgi:hypothetical protein